MNSTLKKTKFVFEALMINPFTFIFIFLLLIVYQFIVHLLILITDDIIQIYKIIILIVFMIIFILLMGDCFLHFRKVSILFYQRCLLLNARHEYYGSILQRHMAYDALKSFEHDVCVICRNKFDFKMDRIKILQCGHIYHEECINKNEHFRWITNKDKNYEKSRCPIGKRKYRIISEKFNYQHNYYQINDRLLSFYVDGLHEGKLFGIKALNKHLWIYIYSFMNYYNI